MPDNKSRETIARQWELLQLLPRGGPGLSPAQLKEKLNIDFPVTERTIQRDLESLQKIFFGKLECNSKSKPYGWKWKYDTHFDIPGMQLADALSLCMVNDALHGLLPEILLRAMAPHFEAAKVKLDSLAEKYPLARWPTLARSVMPAMPMLAPTVSSGVLEDVQSALLENEQIEVEYLAMDADAPKTMTLNPLALVNRGLVSYLLATAWTYTDIRHYALHRIQKTTRTYNPTRRPENFDLDGYIASGAMQFGDGQELVLTARVTDDLARILSETRLSSDQTLHDGILSATVKNTQQLKWWLLSQGADIQVTGPEALVDWIKESLAEALMQYADGIESKDKNSR